MCLFQRPPSLKPKSSRKYCSINGNEGSSVARLRHATRSRRKFGVIMKMNQGMRLPLNVIGSRNLLLLKNPLTLTGMLARLPHQERKEPPKKECYKALSEKLDWENPEGGDYPFDLSKPLPLIKRGKRQRVPFEFFINNDLKYLQGGTWSKHMGVPVKVAYDSICVMGLNLHIGDNNVMRKHGYEYLEEIIIRRADKALYRFKEGDDVADFTIALRMFTRSLVIQKRVEDLQLGVESYQKRFNVQADIPRPDLRKGHPLYSIQRPPRIHLVVRTTEEQNIDMEYLLKRRWSNLEKKRAHFMIKDINKLLKERRMMRSLEKFVGGRLYGTDLRLLQRTI
ncbi:hypothetical protein Tco_0575745 [Tanacetum coccineum]